MQKQWDNFRIICFKIGDPEEEPTITSILLKLKLKRISELLRVLIQFVKTENGQSALHDFISKEKK